MEKPKIFFSHGMGGSKKEQTEIVSFFRGILECEFGRKNVIEGEFNGKHTINDETLEQIDKCELFFVFFNAQIPTLNVDELVLIFNKAIKKKITNKKVTKKSILDFMSKQEISEWTSGQGVLYEVG